jgi:hypothetical protein
LLLEAIAGDAPADPDAPALTAERDLGLAWPDRVLSRALIRVALGLLERRAGHGAAEAALVSEIAGLLGEMKRSAPPSTEPPWPGEPPESETRVLRQLEAETRQLLESLDQPDPEQSAWLQDVASQGAVTGSLERAATGRSGKRT